MIHILPQAPLKNRYTEDWIPMWKRELDKLNVNYTIVGDETTIDSEGLFGNLQAAVDYELKQIQYCFDNLDSIDKILHLDTDFPGLFVAAAQLLKWKKPSLKIFGFCHAGSWNTGDIFSESLGKYDLELATLEIFDKIFVATEYHKKKIEDFFDIGNRDNICVTGLPYYHRDVMDKVNVIKTLTEKELILISGRREQSNGDLIDKFKERYKNLEFVDFSQIKNRRQYFEVLNNTRIAVSFKVEETFGLSQFEVHSLGGLTLSPNKFSYPELIKEEELIYTSEEDLFVKFENLLSKFCNDYFIEMEVYEKSIENMVKLMLDIK